MQSLDVRTVLDTLEKNQIQYCIWKNLHEKGLILAGETDADLHVPFALKKKFERVIFELAAVEAGSSLSTYPFVHHYFLPGSGNKILHLHVYFEIFTGESQLKDYLLPLSQQLVDSAQIEPNLGYVASPEMAYLIYVLRHYLKKSTLMGVLMHLRERKEYKSELEALTSRALPEFPPEFVSGQLLEQLYARFDKAGFLATWSLGRKLRMQLSSLRRLTPMQAFVQRYALMARRVLNKLNRKEKKALTNGGQFIALTGLDGSGKTSLLEFLGDCFGNKFSVRAIHLGRPPATILTAPLRVLLSLRRVIKRSAKANAAQAGAGTTKSLFAALRYCALAYERNRLSRRVVKWVSDGKIVFSDRYPSIVAGKMDSPRIALEGGSKLVTRLGKMERRLYNAMITPDLLVETRVPLEVALRRNDERDKQFKETDEELRDRYAQNSDLAYRAKRYHIFPNDQSLEQAQTVLFDLVWRQLSQDFSK